MSLCFRNTTFMPFICNCTEQKYFLEPSQKLFKSDSPTYTEMNTTGRHSKDWTRTTRTGSIMDMDKLHTKTDFIFPLTHNFAQTLSVNTTIPLLQDIQDDGKPRQTSPETTGGHACKDKSRSTLLDATFANAQNHTEKNLVIPFTPTKFLLYLGNTSPLTSSPAYRNLTDSTLF